MVALSLMARWSRRIVKEDVETVCLLARLFQGRVLSVSIDISYLLIVASHSKQGTNKRNKGLEDFICMMIMKYLHNIFSSC